MNQSQTLKRVDTYTKYVKTKGVNAGTYVWVITTPPPGEVHDSGSAPPGSFPASVTRTGTGGKTCTYVKENTQPVWHYTNDAPWVKQGTGNYDPTGTAAPAPADEWSAEDVDNVTFKKTRNWEATQGYILAPGS